MERWREEKRGPREQWGGPARTLPFSGSVAAWHFPLLQSCPPSLHTPVLSGALAPAASSTRNALSPPHSRPQGPAHGSFLTSPSKLAPTLGPGLPGAPLCQVLFVQVPSIVANCPLPHFPHQTGSFQAGPRLCFSAPLQALAWQSTSNLKRGSKGMSGWLS